MTAPDRPHWPDDRETELRRLRARGYSRKRIAELMGLSVNAIIGKLFRLERADRVRHLADPVNVPAPVRVGRGAKLIWTEAQLALLRALWPSRQTTAQLAERVGHSQNGVTSKAKALGLPDRRKLRGRFEGVGFNFKGRDRQGPTVKPPKPGERARGKKMALCRLTDLPDRNHCMYPLGHPDNSDFRFCGDRAVPERPYCLEHCHVCYQARAQEVMAA